MKILHVITGLPMAAGTSTFVKCVVREQRTIGLTVEFYTNNDDKFLCQPSAFSLQPDLIHIHGLWSPLLHKASCYAAQHNTPVVWSTHGMTAPWSLHHKWWKKCLPWRLYQKSDLKRATLIHCTTELEAEWNHALGFTNTFIAPLGTTLPEIDNNSAVDLLSPSRPKQQRTLLYVGRIYPVKALDNAIRAVALMNHPITLRIVGPDQAGHAEELMTLCDQLGVPYTDNLSERSRAVATSKKARCRHTSSDKSSACAAGTCVHFLGPKYDNDLSAEYDNCDGLILVSHTENFGATVIDAMAHGKPVITSTKTPWSIVQGKMENSATLQSSIITHHSSEGRCGWWVDNDPQSLAMTFDTFVSTSTSDLNVLGQNGRALVEQQYTWPAIARNLISNYERIIHHA